MKTVRKRDIVKFVHYRTNTWTETEIREIVDGFLAGVKSCLLEGDNVTFKEFGTFKIVVRKARPVRNVRLNKPMQMPDTRKVKFVPGQWAKLLN